LAHGPCDVRQASAEALGELGDVRAVTPLVNALSVTAKWAWTFRKACGVSLIRILGPDPSMTVPNLSLLKRLLTESHGDQHADHSLGTYTSSDCHGDHADTHNDAGVGLDIPAGWRKRDF